MSLWVCLKNRRDNSICLWKLRWIYRFCLITDRLMTIWMIGIIGALIRKQSVNLFGKLWSVRLSLFKVLYKLAPKLFLQMRLKMYPTILQCSNNCKKTTIIKNFEKHLSWFNEVWPINHWKFNPKTSNFLLFNKEFWNNTKDFDFRLFFYHLLTWTSITYFLYLSGGLVNYFFYQSYKEKRLD